MATNYTHTVMGKNGKIIKLTPEQHAFNIKVLSKAARQTIELSRQSVRINNEKGISNTLMLGDVIQSPCLHDQIDHRNPVTGISCPCPKCTPYC